MRDHSSGRRLSRDELKWAKAKAVAKRIRDTNARRRNRRTAARRRLVALLVGLAILGALGAAAWWAYQAGWWPLALISTNL